MVERIKWLSSLNLVLFVCPQVFSGKKREVNTNTNTHWCKDEWNWWNQGKFSISSNQSMTGKVKRVTYAFLRSQSVDRIKSMMPMTTSEKIHENNWILVHRRCPLSFSLSLFLCLTCSWFLCKFSLSSSHSCLASGCLLIGFRFFTSCIDVCSSSSSSFVSTRYYIGSLCFLIVSTSFSFFRKRNRRNRKETNREGRQTKCIQRKEFCTNRCCPDDKNEKMTVGCLSSGFFFSHLKTLSTLD